MKPVVKTGTVLFLMLSLLCSGAAAQARGALSLEPGVDGLASALMQEIADRYFDAKTRPVVQMAIFDFTDMEGNVTVGSRYVANRIRLAFASRPQFQILPVERYEQKGSLVTASSFETDLPLRERIIGELKAHVYVLGQISTVTGSEISCRTAVWGLMTPFQDHSLIEPLTGDTLQQKVLAPLPWTLDLNPSGLALFNRIQVEGASEVRHELERENLAQVIFLSQPMVDDLNLAWQVRGDGMVYDLRKQSIEGALRDRTGQVMQARVKTAESLMELSYIIKDFSLVIRETGREAFPLEPYVVPRESDYYFIPFLKGEDGLRFTYLWAESGKSQKPSATETGKGWDLFLAESDYATVLPVGTHMATATLNPVAETDYGTKRPKSEYVNRFKFSVQPGLNIYVINYVYRRDRPEIFVRRLEIEGTRDEPVRAIKRITEVYEVYGQE